MQTSRSFQHRVGTLLLAVVIVVTGCGGSTTDNEPGIDTRTPDVADNAGDSNALSEGEAIELARATAASDGKSLDGLAPRAQQVQGFWTVIFDSPDDFRSFNVDISPDGDVVGFGSTGY